MLFAAAGFVCEGFTLHARVVGNRASGAAMPRRWAQATFRYDPEAAAAAAAAEGAAADAAAAAAEVETAGAADDGGSESEEEEEEEEMDGQQQWRQLRLAGVDWSAPVGCGGEAGGGDAAVVWQPVERLARWLADGEGAAIDGRTLLLFPPPAAAAPVGGAGAAAPAARREERAAWAAAGAWAALALLAAARRGAARAVAAVTDWSDPAWARGRRQRQQEEPDEQEPEAGGAEDDEEEEDGGEHAQEQRAAAAANASAYARALAATLEANEARAVCERLRCRRLRPGDARERRRLEGDARLRGGGSSGALKPLVGRALLGCTSLAAADCSGGGPGEERASGRYDLVLLPGISRDSSCSEIAAAVAASFAADGSVSGGAPAAAVDDDGDGAVLLPPPA